MKRYTLEVTKEEFQVISRAVLRHCKGSDNVEEGELGKGVTKLILDMALTIIEGGPARVAE